MIRIAMWSGPRSISTALMRSFENRPDTFVSDEPFYAHYLNETGENHPYREEVILQGETKWEEVVANIIGDIPCGKQVWYQKHMAQHNLPGKQFGWVDKMNNILLIRHPREVILSYIKKYEIHNISQLGYSQQCELYNLLKEGGSAAPLVLDAQEVLKHPEGMLKELCRRLEIPFYKEMLSWPEGRRDSDGIWGKHWYGSVEGSTGFQKYAINHDIIPLNLEEIYYDCMESYKELYQHRVRILS